MAISINRDDLLDAVNRGLSRNDMTIEFDCSLAHIKRELKRNDVNIRTIQRERAGPEPFWRTAETNYKWDKEYSYDDPDSPDFDPSQIPLEQIDPTQLTILERAKIILGDRLTEKNGTYRLGRTPVGYEAVLKEAGLLN